MHCAFSLLVQIVWLIVFFVLKSYLRLEVEAIQGPSVVNWCSERHCQDCAKSEFLPCSKDALFNRCGDLCGCCQSCVKFRDLGESCGAQLAVRSSADVKFENSRSRVTILATSSCTRGLVCINFICQRRNDKIDTFNSAGVELHDEILNIQANGFQKSFGSQTDVIKLKNEISYQHNNHNEVEYKGIDEYEGGNDVITRKITLPTSTAIPWSITFTKEILLKLGSHKNEVFNNLEFPMPDIDTSTYKSQESSIYNPNVLFGPSRRFLNLIIADREFQLIYGHDALADLKILLNSVDKSQPNTILDEFLAKILYERFKNIVDYVNNKNEVSSIKKEIISSPKALKTSNNLKSGNKKISENVYDTREFPLLRNIIFARTTNTESPRVLVEEFRRKRETEHAEEIEDYVGLEYKNSDRLDARVIMNPNERINDGTNSEFVIYDTVKEAPRTMENVDRHWIIAREVDTEDDLSTDQRMGLSDVESAINIRITGVPSLGLEVDRERDVRDKLIQKNYGSYDENLEVFVADANNKIPVTRDAEESRNLENFTKIEVTEPYKNVGRDKIDNITEDNWDTWTRMSKPSQFSGNVYEFSFPENPVTLESNSLHELDIRINETANEFRDRLDRIETWIVAIGSSIYEISSKLQFNEKSKIIEEEKLEDTNLSTNLNANTVGRQRAMVNIKNLGKSGSEETNEFIERSALTRPIKRIRIPKENSTGTSHRRQWRTVVVQPSLTEGQKNLRGRRRLNRGRINRIDRLPRLNFRRKKLTRFSGDSEEKGFESVPKSFTTRKWLDEDTTQLPGQIKYPINLPNEDYRNLYKYSLADLTFSRQNQFPFDGLFAREYSSFETASDPSLQKSSVSSRRTLWPLNPAWSGDQSLERNKRTSTPETPGVDESIFGLETQIRKPIRSGLSKTFDHQTRGSSMGLEAMLPMEMAATMTHSLDDEFSGKFGEDSDDWSWDAAPSFNLFAVEDQSSEFGLEASSMTAELPRNIVLPMENIGLTKIQENHVDDSWDQIYPEYLDYSERMKINEDKESTIEAETTETSPNNRRTRRIDLRHNSRKKRSSETNESTHLDIKTSVNTDNKKNSIVSIQKMIPGSNLSSKKSKRSVQMVDWLRAAQEYHERLRQVRNAALKTWLASREEHDDTNLTNVKLFTREIPSYLEKYTPRYTVDDELSQGSESSESFSVRNENIEQSMINDGELFGKIVNNESLHSEDKTKANGKCSHMENPEISGSNVPRKFTIITTGNSTIRIEEMPRNNEDINESLLDDQSGEGTINSELRMAHQVDFTPTDSEHFDHMYESFDAEDEDFDYGDPSLTISRLLDEVDVIDEAEASEDGIESISDDSFDEDEEDDEIAELFGRSKRESPFFLFKIKNRPGEQVLIWPSNWKDLINRHLKLNRSRTLSVQPQRSSRRSYVKLSKINPKLVTILETAAKSSYARDAGLSSLTDRGQ